MRTWKHWVGVQSCPEGLLNSQPTVRGMESELGKREKKLSRTSKQEYTCSPFGLDYRSDMITVQRSCTAMKQYGDIVMDKDGDNLLTFCKAVGILTRGLHKEGKHLPMGVG